MAKRVPLFWKLAVESNELRCFHAPGLVPVEQLHVTLLYLGGRSAAKAAPLNDLSVEDLELMSQALQEMKGMEVYFDVTRVLQHADMILAEVALPESLPCAKANPHVTLCRSEHVAPIFAQTLLENPSSCVALDARKLRLCGVVDLEEGPARPGQVREKREADVAEGTWVHVKKHSSMGCAVVTLPTPALRDAILLRCSKVVLQGNSLELKKHHQEQGDGSKLEVPESIFVGWKQPKRTAGSALPLMAEDLLDLFDGFCAH